jgi:DNA sulfur modification protein DndD
MVIDELTLTDFGVYAGKQVFNLAPPHKNQPIVLLGGLNGRGKTTLLDAIQLVLYGVRARCSGRGKRSYREYLRAMIHRGTEAKKSASVEMKFSRWQNGARRDYKVLRSWNQGPKDIDESVTVHCDGEVDHLLSEHWDEYIETFIPRGIAHLFFFDGEQITDLAEGQNAAEILSTAIHTLLGLSTVDQLSNDLVTLERRKRTQLRPTQEDDQVRASQDEHDRIQLLLDSTLQERARLRDATERLQKQLEEFDQEFLREGGALYQKRETLVAERAALSNELDAADLTLRDLAGTAAPLLMIQDLLERTERDVVAAERSRKQVLMLTVLDERDNEILKQLKESKLKESTISIVAETLAADRRKRGELAGDYNSLRYGDEHLAADLRQLRVNTLPSLDAQIRQQLALAGDLTEKIARLDQEISCVPTDEIGAKLVARQQKLRAEQQQHESELAVAEEKVRIIERQLEGAKNSLKRSLDLDIETQLSSEHDSRVLKYSSSVRSTLERFRVAVIRQQAAQLERLVLESFQFLVCKRDLITRIQIDPEKFVVELTGVNGKPLPMTQLSQGERQLLATSLLWGLAKASGRPLPTIIDTPLGRLDSFHRRNMLERYFPVASHQVILLSTDEEVDQESCRLLKPHVGRYYHLQFDDCSNSTTATEGYFWN